MKKRAIVLSGLFAGLALVGCGEKEANNNANALTNNATNNTNNNGATNNASNNGSTNAATNNATSNNATNNSTNNQTMYTAHDFMCPNEITPAGSIADLVGTWNITQGCSGDSSLFRQVGLLCPSGVVTDVEHNEWSGQIVFGADGTVFASYTSVFTSNIYVTEMCSTQLGGGTCEGTAAFINGLAPDGVTASCVDEPPNPGDCICTLTGPGPGRWNSVIEDGASPGTFVETWLDEKSNGTYEVATANWEFETDGTTLTFRNTGNTTVFTGTAAADASDCDTYCYGFMEKCNGHDSVTGYDDDDDCRTQCMGFAAGTPGDMTGDTLACRRHFLAAASDIADVTNPDTHCASAQAAATAPCN